MRREEGCQQMRVVSSLENSDGLLQLSENGRGIVERRPDPVAARSKT